MIKKNLKVIIYSFLISVFFATSLTAIALAIPNASSPTKRYTVYSYTYDNMASIWIWSNGAQARTDVDSINGTVPAGYIGLYCRLYNSSGTLKKSSGWVYNDNPLVGFSTGTQTLNASGTYYSKGASKAYNGNGYNSYDTYQSPNLSY